MSSTNQDTMPEIQEQANNLRQELKEWEKSFAAANQGRKAGRDDIKTHPTIASKYKTYTKLRDLLSSHAPLTSHSSSPHPHLHVQSQPQPQPKSAHQPSPKRKYPIDPPTDAAHTTQTPRKLPRHTASTPSKLQHPSDLDPYDSPSSIRALTHTPRFLHTSIGPTPQRDGRVLGLFDAFPDAAATPSKSKLRTTLGSIPAPNAAPHGNGHVNGTVTLATPSKKRAQFVEEMQDGCAATPSAATGRRRSRTPTSAGRRFLLDSYVTPTARRTLLYAGPSARDGEGAQDNGGSASSLRFATPAFLRRGGRRLGPALADGDGEASPGKGTGFGRDSGGGVRLPLDLRAPVRGGLSSLLAGLRKMEDERLDGEMDVLREVENGDGKQTNNNVSSNSELLGTKDGVLVRDSQAATTETGWEKEMPLGVDRGSSDFDSDSDSDSDAQAKNSRLRTYKKKGQKRTTRRVVMRPQPARPSSGKLLDPSATVNITSTSTDISTVDDLGAEAARSEPVGGGGHGGSGDVGKKAARKISATAHANYRTLKLRGKGAKSKGKGSGSGGRRFGRRR